MRVLSVLAWVAFAHTMICFLRKMKFEINYFKAMKKLTRSMKTILLIHYGVKRAERDGLFKFQRFSMTYDGGTSIVTCDGENKVKVDEVDFSQFPSIETVTQKYDDVKRQYGKKYPIFSKKINNDFKRIDYILKELKCV